MNQLTLHGLVVIEGRATYERIVSSIREMEPDEAIKQIQNFLRIYPEFAQAHNDLAVLYYQAGNGLKALAHHEKAHKLEPSNITFRKNLADFYFIELEWADDAIQTYLDILKDNPFDVETLNALGTISVQIGRREQARQYFTRTLQLDGVNSAARQALQQLGGELPPPQQVQIPVQTSQTPPAPRTATEIHAEALRFSEASRQDEAHSLLEELAHYYDDYAPGFNDLGVMRHRIGDMKGALRAYQRAVELQPANATFRKNLADLYFAELGMADDAIRIYLDLFRQYPRDLETLTSLGLISVAVGHPQEAKSFYRRALEIEPWNSAARAALQKLT